MELPLHQLVPLLGVKLLKLRRRKKRQRKRVRDTISQNSKSVTASILTIFTAKEESDEDMGFGLFD